MSQRQALDVMRCSKSETGRDALTRNRPNYGGKQWEEDADFAGKNTSINSPATTDSGLGRGKKYGLAMNSQHLLLLDLGPELAKKRRTGRIGQAVDCSESRQSLEAAETAVKIWRRFRQWTVGSLENSAQVLLCYASCKPIQISAKQPCRSTIPVCRKHFIGQLRIP